MEPRLVVVHPDARGDVHGGHQDHPLADAGLRHGPLDVLGDAHELAALVGVEGHVRGVGLHARSSRRSPGGGDCLEGDNAAMAGLLSLERRDDVAVVTLQRPEKRNALSDRAADRADRRLRRARRRRRRRRDRPHRRRAGLLLGHGRDPVRRRSRAPASGWSRPASPASRPSANCPKPVVAAVNGPALAGGFALALLCDLRVAVRGRQLRIPRAAPRDPAELRLGARGAAARTLAAELTLTGRILDAFGALKMGIVTSVHPADELMSRALELAGRIASGPRGALAETKRRILLRPRAQLRSPLRRGGAGAARGAARGRSRHGRLRRKRAAVRLEACPSCT